MAEQLWKGRFSKAVDSRVNDFNSSIRFDQRMIAQDMRGSGVHAAMLAKQGIISEKDCEGISSTVWPPSQMIWQPAGWTIDPGCRGCAHLCGADPTARIGDAGKRLHTGRSRNDQVALDIRLTLCGITATPCRLISWSWSRSLQGRQPRIPPLSCPATPTCSAPSPSPSAMR